MSQVSLNTIIKIPKKILQFERKGWFLLFDPLAPSWARVNKDGLKIIDAFKIHKSIKSASEYLLNSYQQVTREFMESTIIKFAETMLAAKFFCIDGATRPLFFNYSAPYPESLYLMLDYRCNLNCSYCYNCAERTEMAKSGNNEMTYEEYCQLIKDAAACGVKKIILTGGEPLLKVNTPLIGRRILDEGLSCELLTNGILLKKLSIKEIRESFSLVTISLDSKTPTINDKHRGSGVFERVMDSIAYAGKSGVKIRINSVITEDTVSGLYETWEWALRELKCDFFTPSLYTPFNLNGDESQNPVAPPSMEKLICEYQKAFEKLPGHYRNAFKKIYPKNSCGMAKGEVCLSPEGDVYPCHIMTSAAFQCGNVKTVKFPDIINQSEKLAQFRQITVDQIEQCRECDFRLLCGGGCIAQNYALNNDLTKNNGLYCDYLKWDVIERLWISTQSGG